MTEKLTKKKTVARGIRVREHPNRRHGVGFDKLYFVRYKINGVQREEALAGNLKAGTLKRPLRNGQGLPRRIGPGMDL